MSLDKHNGNNTLGDFSMANQSKNKRISTFQGNARFIELGAVGAPFRSLLNVDKIINVRFEQNVGTKEAEYGTDGEMTAPPEQWLQGWNVLIDHDRAGQTIAFPDEESAVECYNTILDMIAGTDVPMARMPKLETQPPISMIEGLDGTPMSPDFVPELTEAELDALSNPEFDTDVEPTKN